jgi:L-lactate dehydrogenase (cytochrome)
MGYLKTIRSVLRMAAVPGESRNGRFARRPSVADLRRLARRRLPRGVFDYFDGGAETEWTLRENENALHRVTFRPRVLAGVGDVDTSVQLLGSAYPVPFVLAPIGMLGMAHPGGEAAAARAAGSHGIPFTHSTMGSKSIEAVAAAGGGGPLWFQLYMWRDRALVADMLARADAAGYRTLVVTADTPVFGNRHRDVRNGFSLPPSLGPSTFIDGVLHPGWTLAFLRGGPMEFGNLAGVSAGGPGVVGLGEYVSKNFDPGVSWADLDWLRPRWSGKIVVKGVQTPEDARTAAGAGVDGLVVSNHGGRQLDFSAPAISLLPPIAEAVGDQVDVLLDGGIRSGADILKALALGARSVLIGRAYAYGLAAGGEPGVDYVLNLLTADLRRAMALTGVRRIADAGRDLVTVPGSPGVPGRSGTHTASGKVSAA